MNNSSCSPIDNPGEIDLLSKIRITNRWIPRLIKRDLQWKVGTGKWNFDPLRNKILLLEPRIKPDENISYIGSSQWRNYSLWVGFRFLSESIRPPEGGVIIYFRFKDIKNYYSLHFCLFKKKIELIKRVKGNWKTIGAQEFEFHTNCDYLVTIATNSQMHHCFINGGHRIEIRDGDITRGCVAIGAKYCSAEFHKMIISL